MPWSNSLTEKYLISVENPDSIGWDSVSRNWGFPKNSKFDKNLIGIGLDKNLNKEVRSFLKKNNVNYLSEQKEREFRYNHLDYAKKVLDKHTKVPYRPISDVKSTNALGLIYHGYGPLLWKETGNNLSTSFYSGTDQEFIDAITNFYENKHSERANNHKNFWKNYKNPTIGVKTYGIAPWNKEN